MEVINTFKDLKFDFDKYNADLEGTDYCEDSGSDTEDTNAADSEGAEEAEA